ncbi:MAG TPA: HAD-IA family hydrolase, partial [Candidatus Binatus sp.]|nr:HAD-IA family hydrolase [Candidatus Binatus sp.]
ANAREYPDARVALESLRDRHFRIGVISNVSSHDVASEILLKVGFEDFVDELVTSALTGIRKPDPGIFLYALARMKVKPSDAVHVGDHPVNDVDGAVAAGIRRTALVLRADMKILVGSVEPWARLDNLSSIGALFD